MSEKGNGEQTTILSLSVMDRIKIQSEILPKKFDMLTGHIIMEMAKRLNFTPAETDEFCLVSAPQPNGQTGYRWDDSKARDVEIGFSVAEMKILKDGAKALDDRKEIDAQTYPAVAKILG